MNDETDMLLDLLVDDELPEARRADLLRSLTEAQWKAVAVRFLERQVERKGARQFVAAPGAHRDDAPAEASEASPAVFPFPAPVRAGAQHRGRGRWWTGVAAGLMIAAASVAVTAYVMRGDGRGRQEVASNTNNAAPEFVGVALPPDVVGDSSHGVRLQVPVLAHAEAVSPAMFLPSDEPGTRASLVIVPHDEDSAIAVPVSTSNVKWN